MNQMKKAITKGDNKKSRARNRFVVRCFIPQLHKPVCAVLCVAHWNSVFFKWISMLVLKSPAQPMMVHSIGFIKANTKVDSQFVQQVLFFPAQIIKKFWEYLGFSAPLSNGEERERALLHSSAAEFNRFLSCNTWWLRLLSRQMN